MIRGAKLLMLRVEGAGFGLGNGFFESWWEF